MPVEPRTPKGVLELLPAQQLAFQRMLDTIRRGFERFGYLPVETPAFELTDVLLTKSGGETEKQVFFVQSTGALEQKADRPELALRFDLTVPLARYVAEHEAKLTFPFRRYQIQRVYRGERPQRGRFREFYQCDIDVIGKDNLPLAYDAELPAVIYGIFHELAFGKFTIKINNRKLLRELLESLGITSQTEVLHEVDDLGKKPRAEVEPRIAAIAGANAASRLLDQLASPLAALPDSEGKRDLQHVYDTTIALGVPAESLKIDLSIVRGLDYYTGTVYETFLDEHPRLGSICSGGRYDNLATHYTKSKLPGVGISIGATRLFSQLLEMNLIETARRATADVLVTQMEAERELDCSRIAAELRGAGLNVEVYGAVAKLDKQIKYAERTGVPIMLIYGGNEHAAGKVRLKRLGDRSQHDVARDEVIAQVKLLLQ